MFMKSLHIYRQYLGKEDPGRVIVRGAQLIAAIFIFNAISISPSAAVDAKTNAFRDCQVCPEMVEIPAGEFQMGSAETVESRDEDEGPVRTVNISSAFAVGRYTVNFAEWDACAADGGCNGYRPSDYWGRDKQPVNNISWDDANAYVRWLSKKTGKSYRLLTEAEREYVSRAGTTTPFSSGETISAEQANYDGRYTYGEGKEGEYRKQTVPVDSFDPNPWGLYNVHGNVWEWTEDCWHETYDGAPSNGAAWLNEDDSDYCRRVVRGGSWYLIPDFIRSAARSWHYQDYRSPEIGFRVARSLTD